jgi:hypothetical protein
MMAQSQTPEPSPVLTTTAEAAADELQLVAAALRKDRKAAAEFVA